MVEKVSIFPSLIKILARVLGKYQQGFNLMKICFLDNTKFKYNSNDKYSEKLRGAETALINLSYELSKLGHEVTVFNNSNTLSLCIIL